jgi:hypothetical protein
MTTLTKRSSQPNGICLRSGSGTENECRASKEKTSKVGGIIVWRVEVVGLVLKASRRAGQDVPLGNHAVPVSAFGHLFVQLPLCLVQGCAWKYLAR